MQVNFSKALSLFGQTRIKARFGPKGKVRQRQRENRHCVLQPCKTRRSSVDIKSPHISASLVCPMTNLLVHLCAGSSPLPFLGECWSCAFEPCFPCTTIQHARDPSPFPWRAKHVHSKVRRGNPKWITKLWKALALEDCLTELWPPFPSSLLIPKTHSLLSDLPTLKSSPGALSLILAISVCSSCLKHKRAPHWRVSTHLSVYSMDCNRDRKGDDWTSAYFWYSNTEQQTKLNIMINLILNLVGSCMWLKN